MFTVPYALIGHRAMWLWMITSVAVSLSGGVFAARIAYRLVDPPEGYRWAGWIAGAFAAAALFGIDYYTHYILSAQSDTMIVALCLGAIDCHLYRRYKWAFTLGILAALGRPETFPLIGLYAIWLWLKFPRLRPLVAGGILLLPVMWFGIPGLTSKSFFTAGNIALKSPRALHQNKLFGELGRFIRLHETQFYLLALLGVGLAALRRDRTTLLIAGAAALWVIVEVAFVLHGWPGVPRYLFEAGGVMCVLAGVGIGRILVDLPPLLSRVRIPAGGRDCGGAPDRRRDLGFTAPGGPDPGPHRACGSQDPAGADQVRRSSSRPDRPARGAKADLRVRPTQLADRRSEPARLGSRIERRAAVLDSPNSARSTPARSSSSSRRHTHGR